MSCSHLSQALRMGETLSEGVSDFSQYFGSIFMDVFRKKKNESRTFSNQLEKILFDWFTRSLDSQCCPGSSKTTFIDPYKRAE